MKKAITIFFQVFTWSCFAQFIPEWSAVSPLENNNLHVVMVHYIDQDDNFYVTGGKEYFNMVPDLFIKKFNSSGVLQWTKYYINHFDSVSHHPSALFVDNDGNIFVTCNRIFFGYTPWHEDIYILKYTSTGNLVTGISCTIEEKQLFASTTKYDGLSTFYIVGGASDLSQDSVIITKIGTNGTVYWMEQFVKGTGHDINYDASGNLYVTGSAADANSANIITLKCNPSGLLQWQHTMDFLGVDVGKSITLDNSNNIYVTGYNFLGGDSSLTTLQKINNIGQQLWSNKYNLFNNSNSRELGYNIFINNNTIIINSVLDNFGEITDSKLLRVDPNNGQQQWVYSFISKPKYWSFDNSFNILGAGSIPANGRTELSIEKVTPSGTTDGLFSFTRSGLGTDKANYIKVKNNSSVYAFGTHNSNDTLLFLKLAPAASVTTTISHGSLNKPILDSQYVYDTINFNLPAGSYVRDINVNIDSILHTADADLQIYLVHGNREISLIDRRGGFSDNFIGTRLDDTASTLICIFGTPPFTGYFKPCQPLYQFNSLPANGPWILKIYDRRAPDTGVLKSWSLQLKYEYPIGITQISSEVPKSFSLYQNYPNPFNPNTKIKFNISNLSNIKIIIYDVLGREVNTLVNEILKPGIYETEFSANNLASGVYFYKLITHDFSETKKMILIK